MRVAHVCVPHAGRAHAPHRPHARGMPSPRRKAARLRAIAIERCNAHANAGRLAHRRRRYAHAPHAAMPWPPGPLASLGAGFPHGTACHGMSFAFIPSAGTAGLSEADRTAALSVATPARM
ncbi:hypothetical protein WS68_00220 [Burkholderia sp. TSV86]|nr:hypothetical protein WS68_00220 [Burkholderia sp. TSV86]